VQTKHKQNKRKVSVKSAPLPAAAALCSQDHRASDNRDRRNNTG